MAQFYSTIQFQPLHYFNVLAHRLSVPKSAYSSRHEYSSLSNVVKKITSQFSTLLKAIEDKITYIYKLDKESWEPLDEIERRCHKWIKEIEHIRDEQVIMLLCCLQMTVDDSFEMGVRVVQLVARMALNRKVMGLSLGCDTLARNPQQASHPYFAGYVRFGTYSTGGPV